MTDDPLFPGAPPVPDYVIPTPCQKGIHCYHWYAPGGGVPAPCCSCEEAPRAR